MSFTLLCARTHNSRYKNSPTQKITKYDLYYYENHDLHPTQFITNKIIEQPGWITLLFFILAVIVILEMFVVKSCEGDIHFKLKKDKPEIKASKSTTDVTKLYAKIMSLNEYINTQKKKFEKNVLDRFLNLFLEDSSEDKRELLRQLVYFVSVKVISGFLKSLFLFLIFKVCSHWQTQIMDAIFLKIQNLSPTYFEKQDSIGILTKSFESSMSSLDNVIKSAARLFKSGLEVFITIGKFFFYSKILGLLTIVWMIVHTAICFFLANPARKANNKLSHLRGRQSSFLIERLKNKNIETFSNLKLKNLELFHDITFSTQKIAENVAKPAAVILCALFLVSSVLQLGLSNAILFETDDPKMKASLFISNIALVGSIFEVSQDLPRLTENAIQVPKIFEIINDPENQQKKRKNFIIEDKEPVIEAKNLCISTGDRVICHNLSFSIPYGCKVAVVGSSGSGKTTFINLLAGLNDKFEGTLEIGGKDIKEVSRESIEENLGYVFASLTLFSGTLRENIKMGKDVSDDEIREAMAKCDILYILDKITLDTPLGEGEGILSSGEKKRIIIARALLDMKKKKIRIFDEALSNLDVTTATKILNTLFKENYLDGTVFFIDHSGLLPKDIVFFFSKENGMVIAKHKELIETNEEYREMNHVSQLKKSDFVWKDNKEITIY